VILTGPQPEHFRAIEQQAQRFGALPFAAFCCFLQPWLSALICSVLLCLIPVWHKVPARGRRRRPLRLFRSDPDVRRRKRRARAARAHQLGRSLQGERPPCFAAFCRSYSWASRTRAKLQRLQIPDKS